MAERVLGKDEVTSSILVIGSRLRSLAPLNELRLGRAVRRRERKWRIGASLAEAASAARLAEGSLPRRSCERSERLGEVVKAGGGSNSVVESQPSKLLVAGSIPVSRSTIR